MLTVHCFPSWGLLLEEQLFRIIDVLMYIFLIGIFIRNQYRILSLIQWMYRLAFRCYFKTLQWNIFEYFENFFISFQIMAPITPGNHNKTRLITLCFYIVIIFVTNRFFLLFEFIGIGCSIGKQINNDTFSKAPVFSKINTTSQSGIIFCFIGSGWVQTNKNTGAFSSIPFPPEYISR